MSHLVFVPKLGWVLPEWDLNSLKKEYDTLIDNGVTMEHKEYPEMEGDFLYDPKSQKIVVFKAQEEAGIHFTMKEFENLLHKHGLRVLLRYMSEGSQDALLAAADDILCELER